MFVRLVDHWCNPGCMDKGRELIESVGARAARAPGFVFRLRLERPEDPLLLGTITAWENRDAFDAFQNIPALPNQPSPANLFAKVQDQVFEVASLVGGLPVKAPVPK